MLNKQPNQNKTEFIPNKTVTPAMQSAVDQYNKTVATKLKDIEASLGMSGAMLRQTEKCISFNKDN